MRERGKSDDEIRRMCVEVRKNVRMRGIRWAADDPEQHSFDVTPRAPRGGVVQGEEGEAPPPPPPVTHTVASYFLDRYGIRLQYPKMPLICTGKRRGVEEWFPIEFFFQAFGKTKDATDKLQAALKYNDEHAGTQSVRQVENLLRELNHLERYGFSFNEFLLRFGMELDINPKAFEATVLTEPKLCFEGDGDRGTGIRNGDWRLAEGRTVKKFAW